MPNKIHTETVDFGTYALLLKLQSDAAFESFNLGGGTSLGLQIGHRESIDLDFFTDKEFRADLLKSLPKGFLPITVSDNYIEGSMNGVKVMFMLFAYPLYEKLRIYDGVRYISPVDIGLMKMLAIGGRTTRKDIIDLYFIDRDVMKLEKMLEIFHKFYPEDSHNNYDSLKRMLNKNNYENMPMPKMIKKAEWAECYKLVSSKVLQYYKNLL